jgi:hypothetical protein
MKMSLEKWLNRIDELRAKRDYWNKYLGTPKYDNGIDRYYFAKLTPQQALIAWRDYKRILE